MSHNRQHIIISALVATGQFGPLEVAALEEIAAKPVPMPSGKDATMVGNIVRKQLRKPEEPHA